MYIIVIVYITAGMGMPSQSYGQTSLQQTPQQRAMQQKADSAFAGLGGFK